MTVTNDNVPVGIIGGTGLTSLSNIQITGEDEDLLKTF